MDLTCGTVEGGIKGVLKGVRMHMSAREHWVCLVVKNRSV